MAEAKLIKISISLTPESFKDLEKWKKHLQPTQGKVSNSQAIRSALLAANAARVALAAQEKA